MAENMELDFADIVENNRSENQNSPAENSTDRRAGSAEETSKLDLEVQKSPQKTDDLFEKVKLLRFEDLSDSSDDTLKVCGSGAKRKPQSGVKWRKNRGWKLFISNLDYGITDIDIGEIFSEVGPLKYANIRYDHLGRHSGKAEVFFEKESDAKRAIKIFKNISVNGRVMKMSQHRGRNFRQQKQKLRAGVNGENQAAATGETQRLPDTAGTLEPEDDVDMHTHFENLNIS